MERCFAIAMNGAPRTVEGQGDTALLYFMRNMLGMRGSRFGCGHEQCGAPWSW
jgi:aerobic-type carbon monoxide dehydrogenase small subunit (CoxS/CutS family)